MAHYSMTDRIRAAYATYGSDMTAEAALKQVGEDKIGDQLDYAVLKAVPLELTDGAIRSYVSQNAHPGASGGRRERRPRARTAACVHGADRDGVAAEDDEGEPAPAGEPACPELPAMRWRLNEKAIEGLIGEGLYLHSLYTVEKEHIEQAGRAWPLPEDPVLHEVMREFANYNTSLTVPMEAIARGLVERVNED